MPTPLFEVPNLDAMSVDDLEYIATHLMLLVRYAHEKRDALIARQAGDIVTAQKHEARCETAYKALPVGMRW